MPKKIHNPHDLFFRLSLDNINVATDFFRANLPQKILQKIDLSTLDIQSGSFVDDHLKSTQTDILYQVNVDQKTGYLYLLAEQQDKPQRLMAFRMTRYLFSIMQRHIDQGNDALPIVYGLIVYTGKRSPYPYSTDIFDLFDNKTLAKDILYQPFQLIDLGQLSENRIRKNRLASIVIRLLKNKDAPEILPLILEFKASGIFELAESLGLFDYLAGMIEYILNQTETMTDANQVVEKLAEALPSKRDNIMTIAERLKTQARQEGLHQGLEKGLEKGLHQGLEKGLHQGLHQGIEQEKCSTAKRMLEKGFSDDEIISCTLVSTQLLHELKKILEKDK